MSFFFNANWYILKQYVHLIETTKYIVIRKGI